MKKIIYIFTLLLLFSSCSKSDDGSDIDKNNNLNKEFIIQSEGNFSKFHILAEKYSNFYPTQMFGKKNLLEDGVFSEIKTKVYPYSLIFDFYPIPYTEEVLEPKDALSFTKVMTNAMKSEGWKLYNESGITKSQLISYAIYSSKDDAKAFLGEPSLYKLLDGNEGKYIFLAKIISSKFNILTSVDDKLIDNNFDDVCYVSSVTIGRYAYLSIFTNEDPKDIIDLFVNGIIKRDVTYIDEYLKFSSSINLVERGGSDNNGYWGEKGFHKLMEIFNTNSRYVGVPISFILKDVATKEIINL